MSHEIEALEARDRLDLGHEPHGRAVVLTGRGLVEDQRGRLESEGDGDGEALLLSEREGQGRPIEDALEPGERGALQNTGGQAVEGRRIAPEIARSEQELLAHRPCEEHLAGTLEDISELGRELRDRASLDGVTVDQHRPGRRPHEAHRRAEEGRLARAVRPEHGHDLALSERGIDAPEHLAAVIARMHAAVLEPRDAAGVLRAGRRPARCGGSLRVPSNVRDLTDGRRRRRGPSLAPRPAAADRPIVEHAVAGSHLPAGVRQDHVEGQLDGVRIGHVEEAGHVALVYGSAVVHREHAVRTKLERLLNAMLDDDDSMALVGELAEEPDQP